jgi:hypothetical protein
MKKTAMIIMVTSVWYVTLANIPKYSATYYEAIKPEVQKAH